MSQSFVSLIIPLSLNNFDILDCNWTVDVTSAILTNNDDYFKVKNEKFEAKDVDGNCIWLSPSINISNYHNDL